MLNNYNYWMQYAYNLAKQAQNKGEIPVGAVLVDQSGLKISEGFNQVICRNDPTAHAEIVALRSAGQVIQNYRFNHTTLFVTLEPCLMCAAAMVHARIERVVFATRDFAVGAAGSAYNILNDPRLNHQVHIDEGWMQFECAELLKNFFRNTRG